jgi:hypothetical protein
MLIYNANLGCRTAAMRLGAPSAGGPRSNPTVRLVGPPGGVDVHWREFVTHLRESRAVDPGQDTDC